MLCGLSYGLCLNALQKIYFAGSISSRTGLDITSVALNNIGRLDDGREEDREITIPSLFWKLSDMEQCKVLRGSVKILMKNGMFGITMKKV